MPRGCHAHAALPGEPASAAFRTATVAVPCAHPAVQAVSWGELAAGLEAPCMPGCTFGVTPDKSRELIGGMHAVAMRQFLQTDPVQPITWITPSCGEVAQPGHYFPSPPSQAAFLKQPIAKPPRNSLARPQSCQRAVSTRSSAAAARCTARAPAAAARWRTAAASASAALPCSCTWGLGGVMALPRSPACHGQQVTRSHVGTSACCWLEAERWVSERLALAPVRFPLDACLHGCTVAPRGL